MSRPAIEIDSLNVAERLELIESLWESLVVDPSNIPVTDAQKQMLDERLDEIDAGDDAGIPWEDVKARIQKRLS
jgi:putative addiction module component (TIGR02574 family)